VRDKADRNLDVECDRDHQFPDLENILMRRADVYVSRGLEDERCESKGYPTPPNALVYFPDGVPSFGTASSIGPSSPR
jgi:hypothetical protein